MFSIMYLLALRSAIMFYIIFTYIDLAILYIRTLTFFYVLTSFTFTYIHSCIYFFPGGLCDSDQIGLSGGLLGL